MGVGGDWGLHCKEVKERMFQESMVLTDIKQLLGQIRTVLNTKENSASQTCLCNKIT